MYLDLAQQIRESYTPKAEVVEIDTVFNYKGYMDSCIDDISGHSKPLCFKFQLNEEGKALLEYRDNSKSVWNKIPNPLLKVCMHVHVYVHMYVHTYK